MTHTPGPWTYKLQEPRDDYVGKKPFRYVIRGADGRTLCKIWHLQEPDARLIAAAPDMLAELVSLREEFMSLFELADKTDQPINFYASALEKLVAEIDGVITKAKDGAE